MAFLNIKKAILLSTNDSTTSFGSLASPSTQSYNKADMASCLRNMKKKSDYKNL